MTTVKPFRALRYNLDKVRDLSTVICPPYDIISPEQQQYYHDLDPHNLIHVLLGRDIPGDDKYRRAGLTLREWVREKILVQEQQPAIYFYRHQYQLKGETKTRLGFIALLHLGQKQSSAYAHEHTKSEAKEDRVKLLRQVKANLSPIFVVFPDKQRLIQRVYEQCIGTTEPFLSAKDPERSVHHLWRIDAPEWLAKIQQWMRDEPVFIADGHHRYEVACAFRDEMRQKLGKLTGEEDYNYLMAYFTNTDARGLTILPVHRIVIPEQPVTPEVFFQKAAAYFDVEEIKDRSRFFFVLEKAGGNEHVIGMYHRRMHWLLRLKNVKVLERLIPEKPSEYRGLDVAILNTLILQGALGIDPVRKEQFIFTPQAQEVIARVDQQQEAFGFLLNPVKITQIMAVALKGERMPPKSTYFYPKVASGLVLNQFSQE